MASLAPRQGPGCLDVRNTTRRPAPRFAYEKALKAVLPGWDVSLVFVGSARALTLNKTLRQKSYVPNVLSYESGTKSGEVIICLDRVYKECSAYSLPPTAYSGYLFIHGLMHLKGHRHGTTMERLERAYLARLISSTLSNETTHSYRYRYRNAPNARRRG